MGAATITRMHPVRSGEAGRQARLDDRGSAEAVQLEHQPLHPRGVGQILDTSLDILVSRFAACVGFAALCWIPYQVAKELILSSTVAFEFQIVWAMGAFVPEYLVTGLICSFVGTHLVRRDITAWTALQRLLPAALGLLMIAMLQAVLTGVGACLCLLPALIAYWLLSATPAVYVLERERLVRERGTGFLGPVGWILGLVLSVSRSVRLVLGLNSFRRWLGWASVALLAIYLPLRGIPAALENPSSRLFLEDTLGIQSRPAELALITMGAVFMGISTAYLAILKTVYYVDQRVRREAFDLEMTLDRLDERARTRR